MLFYEIGMDPPSGPFPRVRDGIRPEIPVSTYFDANLRGLVRQAFQWEIEKLGELGVEVEE